jgi:coenzyme PQQ precursor peptide PqqA
LSKREIALSKREISALKGAWPSLFRTCAAFEAALGSTRRDIAPNYLQASWEIGMTWKTPKIVEVPVGMEINMYACAARK